MLICYRTESKLSHILERPCSSWSFMVRKTCRLNCSTKMSQPPILHPALVSGNLNAQVGQTKTTEWLAVSMCHPPKFPVYCTGCSSQGGVPRRGERRLSPHQAVRHPPHSSVKSPILSLTRRTPADMINATLSRDLHARQYHSICRPLCYFQWMFTDKSHHVKLP